jgi:hypothetical protein
MHLLVCLSLSPYLFVELQSCIISHNTIQSGIIAATSSTKATRMTDAIQYVSLCYRILLFYVSI